MIECYEGWTKDLGNTQGRCCCNCKYHVEDFWACVTIDRIAYAIEHDVAAPKGCVCSLHKGWICTGTGRAHSGWKEHGMCEVHEWRQEMEINDETEIGVCE